MAKGSTETLTIVKDETEMLGVDTQFVKIDGYIDLLRRPERDDRKEVERTHVVDFAGSSQDVQFVSPFRRAANISIEYPPEESHSFFVDTAQQTVRRTIWRDGRIIQSDLVLSRQEALIARREYPAGGTEGAAELSRLDAEEALQLLTVAYTALDGLQRALAE